MKRKLVKSSNLKDVGYDPATQELQVGFLNGNIFSYAGVPQEDFEALMAAESIGKAFNAGIRGIFESTKLAPADEVVEEAMPGKDKKEKKTFGGKVNI